MCCSSRWRHREYSFSDEATCESFHHDNNYLLYGIISRSAFLSLPFCGIICTKTLRKYLHPCPKFRVLWFPIDLLFLSSFLRRMFEKNFLYWSRSCGQSAEFSIRAELELLLRKVFQFLSVCFYKTNETSVKTELQFCDNPRPPKQE